MIAFLLYDFFIPIVVQDWVDRYLERV